MWLALINFFFSINKEDMLWGGGGIRCESKGLRGVGRAIFYFISISLGLRKSVSQNRFYGTLSFGFLHCY